jgi:hypothetical protein
VRSPQVRSTPLLRDPLLLVSSPTTETSPVQLTDLRDTLLLLLAAGTGLNELIKSRAQPPSHCLSPGRIPDG